MKVALIFGGKSTEHEVSCLSAASVLENIKGHEVYRFAVTKTGEWFVTEASIESIRNGKWVNEPKKTLAVSLSDKAFICEGEKLDIDVAFPLIHGRNGEDGRLQGLLEMLGVKYVGPGVLGSAVCMDKITANRLFASVGITHAEWFYITAADFNLEEAEKKAETLGFPVFIKPSNAGSSVGITKCHNKSALAAAFSLAFENDSRVIVEKGIESPEEIEIAVLGNDNPVASATGRILPSNEIYDYEAKYLSEESKTVIPSGISDETEREIKRIALLAYKTCDCRGLSRIDFLIGKDGTIYINEINTLPGFTKISMYPKLFIAGGMTYTELINKLLDCAAQ